MLDPNLICSDCGRLLKDVVSNKSGLCTTCYKEKWYMDKKLKRDSSNLNKTSEIKWIKK